MPRWQHGDWLPAGRRVAILGGNRIPFARSNTAYSTASNQDMLTFTLQGLIDRYNLHGERLGEVAAGTARGLISICAAGGQGVVAILER